MTMLLGNQRVPQVSFYPGSVAALMTSGSVLAGLVIDCGHRVASVTPVYDACVLPPYATSTPLAGAALFANVCGLLQNHTRLAPASSSDDVDCQGDDALSDSVVAHVMTQPLLTAMIPRLTIDMGRYGHGHLPFPSWVREHTADHQSIPDPVVQCVGCVPINIRRALVTNVLVIGSIADLPGFSHRLLHDIVARLRSDRRWLALVADAALVEDSVVFAPSDQAWVGTSLAVAAKIGTVEVSCEDFDGYTLLDWTTIVSR
ncbi:hypothetical protein FBU31_000597 [Coemansia sp. 'formosensis']|nr:hypothetical protein FBU31_000597 [Coemansia sp. 'formosensis']